MNCFTNKFILPLLWCLIFNCAIQAADIIRIGSPSRTMILDPIKSAGAGNIETFGVLYSRLLRRDENGHLVPGLAKSWSYSADNTELTFQLRDAKFSNGEPISPEDIIYSITRFRDNEASVLGDVVKKVISMRVIDRHAFSLKLSEPYAPILDNLELVYAGIVSKSDIETRGEEVAFSTVPVSSGAYRVLQWKPNDRLIVEANPYYWREGYPKNDGAELIEVMDSNTRISMLLAGELDVVRAVPWSKVTVLDSSIDADVVLEDAILIQSVLLNHASPPFDDIRVRQAAVLSLDREAIARVVTHGNAPVANTVTPSSLSYHDREYQGWVYNPDKARELMRQAGAEGTKVKILIQPAAEAEKVAVIIQAQWREVGLDAEIVKADQGLWWELLQNAEYDAAPAWWFNENPEPDGAVRWALCGSCGTFSYYTNYQNAEIDRLAELGAQEQNDELRKRIYQDIQRIATQEVSQIPLYYPPWSNAYSRRISGMSMTPNLQWTLEEAELLPDATNQKGAGQ